MPAIESTPISRVWRGGAPWTRSAVDAPPRDWLVLYLHAEADPMRPTTKQHLRFLEHSLTPHNVLYWNAWHGVPGWIRSYPYDVVRPALLGALHALGGAVRALALDARLDRPDATPSGSRCRRTSTCARPRSTTGWASLDVDCVFSVLDGRHWPVLYPERIARTRMERSYTGFVDDRAAGAVEHLPGPHAARAVDIVYRARNLPYHIGHHGQLKHEIAADRRARGARRGLRTDISTDIKDTKYGDAWFEFLASGRCVIGTESGSSALDPVGAIRRFESEWRPSHPDATFEEFSALQEPGWDDYDFTAISPRLFEAAQTKTVPAPGRGRL